MTRVHPQFLMNGFKKAVEKQDFGEFNKELTNGMNYWTNLFNTEVGALDPDEAPLIIAALEELASTYKKTVPGAGNIADTFRNPGTGTGEKKHPTPGRCYGNEKQKQH